MHIGPMACAVVAAAGLAGTASADVVIGTFDAGPEGWLVADGDSPAHQSATAAPRFEATGGNGGGFITTPLPWTTTAFFVAPEKFLGDQSDKFGGAVEVDRRFVEPRISTDPYQIDYDVDMTMTGAGMTLAVGLAPVSIEQWESFRVDLSSAGGWHHLGTNAPASDDDIEAVLASLEDMRVRGNLNDVFGNVAIDNFSLVPSPGTLAVLGAGAIFLRRRRA